MAIATFAGVHGDATFFQELFEGPERLSCVGRPSRVARHIGEHLVKQLALDVGEALHGNAPQQRRQSGTPARTVIDGSEQW